jgi:hypothetical protein
MNWAWVIMLIMTQWCAGGRLGKRSRGGMFILANKIIFHQVFGGCVIVGICTSLLSEL